MAITKNESYLGVTAHFINDEFNIIKQTMAIRYLEDPHTAEYIYQVLIASFENKVRLPVISY
jgi:hypothetical protein